MILILLSLSCNQNCDDVFIVNQDESNGIIGIDPRFPLVSCPDGVVPSIADHYILHCTEGCGFNNGLDYCVMKKDLDDFAKNSCCNIVKNREDIIMHAELDCDGNFFKNSTH